MNDILSGLKYQDGNYDLIKLQDKEYQDKLQVQIDYWNKIKKEIEAVRSSGYENTDIVNMSEIYFTMADETVSAAESYSEKIAIKIRTIELLSALLMGMLLVYMILSVLYESVKTSFIRMFSLPFGLIGSHFSSSSS